jgi:hypothetical protein
MEEFNWLADYNEADWVDVGQGPNLPNNGTEAMVEMSDPEDEFDPTSTSLPPAPAPAPTSPTEPEQPSSSSSSVSESVRRSQRMVVLDDEEEEEGEGEAPPPAPPATNVSSRSSDDLGVVVGTREEEWSE